LHPIVTKATMSPGCLPWTPKFHILTRLFFALLIQFFYLFFILHTFLCLLFLRSHFL
jgi:hypothetical protein